MAQGCRTKSKYGSPLFINRKGNNALQNYCLYPLYPLRL